MTQADPPITIDHPWKLSGAPESAVLGFDHQCRGCGYNLIGIAIGGVCPECSESVRRSLKRGLLRIAPERTLRCLRNGARCVTVAMLLPLAILGIAMYSTFVIPGFGPRPAWADLLDTASLGLLIVIWLLFTVGWILLTWRLEGLDEVPEADKVRRRCRVATLIFSLSLLTPAVISAGFPTVDLLITATLASLVILVLLMFQIRHGTHRVRKIALDIPNKRLAAYARTVYWALLTNVIITIVWIAMIWSYIIRVFVMSGTSRINISVVHSVAWLIQSLILALTVAGYAMYIGLFRRLWVGMDKLIKAQREEQCVS